MKLLFLFSIFSFGLFHLSVLLDSKNNNVNRTNYCIKVDTTNNAKEEKFQWRRAMQSSKKFNTWTDGETLFRPIYFISSPGSGSRWIMSLIGGGIGTPGLAPMSTMILVFKYYIVQCSVESHNSNNIPQMLTKVHHLIYKEFGYLKNETLRNELSREAYQNGGIILLRNPYHSILSHMQHDKFGPFSSKSWSNITKHIETNPESFKKSFLIRIDKWVKLYKTWLLGFNMEGGRVLILLYEDFLVDPKVQLEKVFEFFNISTNWEERVSATLKDIKTTTTWKRKSYSKETKLYLRNFFNADTIIRKKVSNGIKKIERMLGENFDYTKQLRKMYKYYMI